MVSCVKSPFRFRAELVADLEDLVGDEVERCIPGVPPERARTFGAVVESREQQTILPVHPAMKVPHFGADVSAGDVISA